MMHHPRIQGRLSAFVPILRHLRTVSAALPLKSLLRVTARARSGDRRPPESRPLVCLPNSPLSLILRRDAPFPAPMRIYRYDVISVEGPLR